MSDESTLVQEVEAIRQRAVSDIEGVRTRLQEAEREAEEAREDLARLLALAVKVGLTPKELEGPAGRSARSISLLISGGRKGKKSNTEKSGEEVQSG